MLLRSGTLPLGDQWSYEPTWDGFRALGVVRDGTTLLSRRGNDLTYMCQEIDSLGSAIPDSVLDGELVPFRDGQPSPRRALGSRSVRSQARGGVLTIQVPVAPQAQPRRIEIRGGEETSQRQIVDVEEAEDREAT
jgi:ATP-dependent DNA ligase